MSGSISLRIPHLRLPTRRRRHRERGTTAIELGFLLLPFLMLIFGIIELSLSFFANKSLDNAVQEAARLIRTGQAQEFKVDPDDPDAMLAITEDEMKQLICDIARTLPRCMQNLELDARSADRFADLPLPGTFKADGTVDPDSLTSWNLGVGDDIVLLSAYYGFKIVGMTDFHNLKTQADGTETIISAIAFVNEPF